MPEEGAIEGGRLVVAGWPAGWASALAETPDGATARIQAGPGETEGASIAFTFTRSIQVRLRYADGKPASGIRVVARNGGGNDLLGPVPSNDEGLALLDGLAVVRRGWNVVGVFLLGGSSSFGGARIGMVDLGEGDAALEAVVGREREVVVRVRVDGKPFLPPSILVRLGSAWRKGERDEEAALLRLRWRPPLARMKAYVQVDARGFVSHSQALGVEPGVAPLEIEVDLRRAGRLVGRVTRPADERHHLIPEVWREKEGDWARAFPAVPGASMPRRVDERGEIRFPPLPPGRYRIRDSYTAAVSRSVEVAPGDEPAVVEMDLSASYEVSGRVVGPDGVSPSGFGVEVEGLEGPAPRGYQVNGRPLPRGNHRTGCREDGTFRIRLPGGGPWTLVPSGRYARPAADGGRAAVSGPRDDVVLRLEPASLATVRFDREFAWRMNPGQPRSVRVFLYEGDPVGPPAHPCTGWGEGRTVTFSGFVPGTWTVWIDASPFAPAVLRGVVLGEGAIDLGEVAASEGARIRVHLRVPEGQV
ncbi:MAG: hypothetical protein ACC662_11620, partial [Planctomycetota bacterium]